ncbi:10143_t:CDS:2 [Acaulospora morrowiae]|uniref:10143_t:CDS:1 n=1 Tax=Acaulospora morrowiae TaxID=94023 RepID=A0A9N9GR32_9GLOM|nr:10143_t:CDS:2 [Acaulospora morrowiae]
MDAGGVQVQHQPSNQSWKNTNSSNGDQGKRRDSNSSKSGPVNLKSINTERAQNTNTISKTAGAQPLRTPKTAQFPRPNQQNQQQVYAMPPKIAKSVQQQQINLSKSSPPQTVLISNSPPHTYNLSGSPPKDINNVAASSKQKSASSAKHTPKPLNLSKSSSQVPNLGRVPQTATFPPKVNRALNLPNPPKTATFPPKSGFPKDIRQAIRVPQSATIPQPTYAYVYGEPAYIQAVEQSRFRHYSNAPAPVRFVTTDYRQVGPGTPVVVLSHPEDSDSQGSGSAPPTPGYGPPEGFAGSDIYDLYPMQYEEEAEESQYVYYYYDYSQQDYPPQTPTGTSPQQTRQSSISSSIKEGRRRSVFGGAMKVHPDAVLPIRQPKGPDMAKNFATRIRRKAVNKLYAAAAERRSKSAADRRKSAMF